MRLAQVRLHGIFGINGRVSRFSVRSVLCICASSAFGVFRVSDGAPWIRKAREEILVGRKAAFVLDLFHASNMRTPL